jgi:plastocyanin
VIVAAFAALLLPVTVGADPLTLTASVGPEFDISLTNADGSPVKHLDVGTYVVQVTDQSGIHDFAIEGPGVKVTSGLEFVGTATWSLTFVNGSYRFFCTPHHGVMHGSFDVGTGVEAKPQALSASVGPGAKISLARTAQAGKTTITVRDLSAKDNFHLRGPGVNSKTGVAFKGTVKWTVSLKAGAYTYRSDAHPALHGALRVS